MGYLITLINDNHLGAAREPEATAVDNPLTDGHSPMSVCFFILAFFFFTFIFIYLTSSRAECGETRLRIAESDADCDSFGENFAEIERRVSEDFRVKSGWVYVEYIRF